ncbi:MAG: error-prone DNA polymerase [Spirochaetes bacterium]|nr:MAG: error-prone DNA polymerase [Spirochaetota bacterium]
MSEALTPLVVQSTYTFLRGVASPKELVQAASSAGLSRLALTDRNGMRGLPAFVEACRKAGISPITGVEFSDSSGRLVLIARTIEGYSFLTKTLTLMANPGPNVDVSGASARKREGRGTGKRLSVEALRDCQPEYARDLFVLADDPAVLGRLMESSPQGAGAGGWLFCLVTPCNKARWAGLAATGQPAAASPELRFLEVRQREVQRLLLAIGRKAGYGDIEDEELDPAASAWSEEALRISGGAGQPWAAPQALGPWLAKAAVNNRRIAELALGDPFSGFHFPAYQGDLLSGGGAPAVSQAQDPAELLRALVREGAARRYGHCGGEVAARIDYEMALIVSKGFCDYFLIVRDIVRRASRVCGRGSAAASIVSYCLGITEVDPLRHNLYFDRFLNPGRKDPPDIDIDFAWDERDGILEALVKAYGPGRVARVANHNCFRDRSALRETARAFGMPDQEISAFERSLRVDQEAALAQADPAWRRILGLAKRIVDFPRHLGTHSGGIVIVPEDIARYAPIEETGTGIRVLSWDKEGTEQAGLVKIDLLGNRSLAVVRDAADSVRAQGIALDAALGNPLDNLATVALLARGDSMGVFYVESPAMRLLQKKTGRGDFEHLVIHSSIIRPAANAYINEYIDRLKGKPWKPLHPLLEGLFDETYGILCYQEDVSKAAMALAGFSSAQADGLRKILAKKDADARLQEHWPAFSRGAAARGVDSATIQAVWDMMRSFSGYSFVKAHSASYAMLSFQSAYLRAHHPAAFMAAVMSNHGGFYSPLAYASEARRMGLRLLSPDVNESQWRCQGRGKAIRFGFCMVANLSAAAAQAILDERRASGPFSSADQFARRVTFERSDAEALVGCGALDSLLGQPERLESPGRSGSFSRASVLMTLLSVCAFKEDRAGSAVGRGPGSGASGELFPEEGFRAAGSPYGAGSPCVAGPLCEPSPPRRLEPLSQRKRRQAEFKYLGTTLDCHPLELWPRLFSQERLRARDLERWAGRRVRLLAWPITAKPVLTASEEPMEFVSFEDETAIFEAVLFPEAYKKFRHLLFEEGPLWVEGLAEKDRGALTLAIESIKKGE